MSRLVFLSFTDLSIIGADADTRRTEEKKEREKSKKRKERQERKASAERKEQERSRKEGELEALTESQREDSERLVTISEERRGADLVPELPYWFPELGKTMKCAGCTLLAQQVADTQKELKALKKKLLKTK